MRESLRIVHTESSCGWGGQEIRTLTEMQGMARRGHRVALLCPKDARIFSASRGLGLTAVPLPIARKSLGGFVALCRWFLREAGGVDVVNCHSSTDSWLVALACTLLADPPPVVRTRHVSSPVRRSALNRWLYQHAARHVITTGEALREQLHTENGFPLEHMSSIPTGIDLERFAPRDRHAARTTLHLSEGRYLGVVSTLRNWKGHTYLLEAFAGLAAAFPEWRLLIVGDGPQRRNLETRIAQLALSSCVHMVGERDDIPLWLNALDVFVLPSYGEEGMPQAIMQAMACGIPVVSTSVGAIREAVVDGETGLIVPPRDAAALQEALARLFTDEGLRRRLGAAGVARAHSCFGIETMLDRMEVLFRRYARQRGAA